MTVEYVDYVVIGFSLSGIAAALSLANGRERVVIVDFHRDTDPIEDLPRVQATSLGRSMSGVEFCETITSALRQARVSREILSHVTRISSERRVTIECDDRQWQSRGVVFAPNGTEPGISVPGALSLSGFGISYSAVADAPYYSSRRVAVYGDSPRVIEHASVAGRYASDMVVLVKQAETDGDPELVRELRVSRSVTFERGALLRAVRESPERTLSSIEIETASGRREIEVDALFVAQHLQPRTEVIERSDEHVVFAGLSAGIAYWKHADLVTDGIRAARRLAAVQR